MCEKRLSAPHEADSPFGKPSLTQTKPQVQGFRRSLCGAMLSVSQILHVKLSSEGPAHNACCRVQQQATG